MTGTQIIKERKQRHQLVQDEPIKSGDMSPQRGDHEKKGRLEKSNRPLLIGLVGL
jgi:hypothetical protein